MEPLRRRRRRCAARTQRQSLNIAFLTLAAVLIVRYQARPVRVSGFEDVVQAHQAMEEGLAAGKMVVAVS